MDIKPCNILVSINDNKSIENKYDMKLSDFGASR